MSQFEDLKMKQNKIWGFDIYIYEHFNLIVMRNDKENLIVNLSLEFALEIIGYCEVLEEKKKFVISN